MFGKLYSKDMNELHNLHILGHLKYTDPVTFKIDNQWVDTTYGRLMIWEISGLLINEPLNKSSVSKLVMHISHTFEKNLALKKLKQLQDIGFRVSTESGVSLCYDDFILPNFQDDITPLQNALIKDSQVKKIDRLKMIDNKINEKVSEWKNGVDPNNSLYLMYKSGARVTDPQIRQILIAKGLLTEMDGSISDVAITGSLGRGLNPVDYFKTCGPARRGLANNFFVVPASGYFARQLVNCARDLVIMESDCGDTTGIEVEAKYAINKFTLDGKVITKEYADEHPDELVTVRSALTCKCHKGGICKVCAGLDPATNTFFRKGFGIGTTAAQHLTEPATQLGLRGKHTSGSVNLNEYEHGIGNVLIDIIRSFGAVGTSFFAAGHSKSKTFQDFMDEEDDVLLAAVKHSEYIVDLYKSGGIKIAFLWPEIILRACTDLVKKKDGSIGLRSYGDKGEIMYVKVNKAATYYPSWLKSLGYGYIKQRLMTAVQNLEVSKGCYTERIMTTRVILDDEE